MYDEDLDDALDEYRGLIDDYDSQLSDLEEQEYEAKMNCREELREIDAPQDLFDRKKAYHEPVYPRNWKKSEDNEQ